MEGYKIKTKAFLKHVKDSGGIISLIAQRIGCDRSSLTAWLNRNPTFWEYVYSEREKVVDMAETKLLKKLKADEDWAIKFILGSTNRGRTRGYGDKVEMEHSGQVDVKGGVQLIIHEKNEK